jgi:hypothetical protein
LHQRASQTQEADWYNDDTFSKSPRRQRQGLARSGRDTLRLPDAGLEWVGRCDEHNVRQLKAIDSIAKTRSSERNARGNTTKAANY